LLHAHRMPYPILSSAIVLFAFPRRALQLSQAWTNLSVRQILSHFAKASSFLDWQSRNLSHWPFSFSLRLQYSSCYSNGAQTHSCIRRHLARYSSIRIGDAIRSCRRWPFMMYPMGSSWPFSSKYHSTASHQSLILWTSARHRYGHPSGQWAAFLGFWRYRTHLLGSLQDLLWNCSLP